MDFPSQKVLHSIYEGVYSTQAQITQIRTRVLKDALQLAEHEQTGLASDTLYTFNLDDLYVTMLNISLYNDDAARRSFEIHFYESGVGYHNIFNYVAGQNETLQRAIVFDIPLHIDVAGSFTMDTENTNTYMHATLWGVAV